MNVRIQWLILWGCVLAVSAGCGSSEAEREGVDPDALPYVEFTIQMAGKDVDSAMVEFQPKAGGSNQKVLGVYDAEDSCYRIVTGEGGKQKIGAPAGEYTVVLKQAPKGTTQIPTKYADPATSGLAVVVNKGINKIPALQLTP